MRALIVLLITMIFSSAAFAAELNFDFRTFKVRTHFTEAAAPLRWDEKVFPFEVAFKNRSYREMSNQPHRWFAGKYVLVETGCGTSCQAGVLVNRMTGKVVPNSDLPVAGSGYEYRYNSALLVVNPTSMEILADRDYFPDQTTYYFVWTTTGWKKLAEEKWPETPRVSTVEDTSMQEKIIEDKIKIPVPVSRPN